MLVRERIRSDVDRARRRGVLSARREMLDLFSLSGGRDAVVRKRGGGEVGNGGGGEVGKVGGGRIVRKMQNDGNERESTNSIGFDQAKQRGRP